MESSEGDLPGWKVWTCAPLGQKESEKTMAASIRIGGAAHVSDNATVRRIMSRRSVGCHLSRKNGRRKNQGCRRVGGRLVRMG